MRIRLNSEAEKIKKLNNPEKIILLNKKNPKKESHLLVIQDQNLLKDLP